jgi:hypothetical protein
MKTKRNYKSTAKYLFEEGLSVHDYADLQEKRKERLNLWLDRGIRVIAKEEMKLINYGDKVLIELKKLYDTQTPTHKPKY